MDVAKAVSAFGRNDGHLPVEAMEWALECWDDVSPVLIALLSNLVDSRNVSPQDCSAAFLIAILAAERRDGRAFAPICAIGRDVDLNEEVFGEATAECYASLLISTFDGDRQSLTALIEDPGAADWARSQAFLALAYLTKTGRLNAGETEAYLQGCFGMLEAGVNSAVSYGWQEAIAMLGLESLAPLVRDAFQKDILDPALVDYPEFEEALRETLASTDPLYRFSVHNIAPIDDAVDYLSDWYGFSEEYRLAKARGEDDEGGSFTDPDDWIASQPVINPLRDIGRNDPCPCGSGKKFKKCCLAQA